MTTELTKAAQQALEALEAVMRHVRREAPHLTGKLWGFADSSADALRRALTQRPAAQTEREAFESWTQSQPYGKYPLRRDQEGQYQADETDVAWDAWQARASLPAPQQATQALADTLRKIDAASCKDCAATGYIDHGEPDSPDGPGRPSVVCGACMGTGWRNGVHVSDQQATPEPLTGCNCRWKGDTQVEWCEHHRAHLDAIHEWAQRAKSAEAKLKATPEPIAQSRQCTEPMCACMGGPCAECPEGEREKEIADLLASRDFYKRRADSLQKAQSHMRDPERTMVCDILANGALLVPAGDRYAATPEPVGEPNIMAMVNTLIASVNEAHHANSQEWRDASFESADRVYEKIKEAVTALYTRPAPGVPDDVQREIAAALALFPINISAQSFVVNGVNEGRRLEADGDTYFFSQQKVIALLEKLHTHLAAAQAKGGEHE